MVGSTKKIIYDEVVEPAATKITESILSKLQNLILKNKSDLMSGDEYLASVGTQVDDVTRNVLTNKLNKQSDLFNIATNLAERKNRMRSRALFKNDAEISDFITSIESIPVTTRGQETNFTPEIVTKFADIYNQRDPLKQEYMRTILGKNVFNNLRSRGSTINAEEGGITKETIDYMKNASNKKISAETDIITARAENVLKNYKSLVPDSTGYDLKPNNLGEVDIDTILSLDPALKAYLTVNGKLSKGNKFAILNKLKKEGVIDELGLGEMFLVGPKTMSSSDPQILNYLAKAKTGKLPKHFKFTQKILTEPQRLELKNIFSNIADVYKPLELGRGMMKGDLLSKKVKELFENNVNRMIGHGIRRQGKTVDQVMESLIKQTDDPEFAESVVPLMIKKVQLQDKIDYYKSKSVDLDDVNLSHMTAVVDDIDTTFKLNNIFIGPKKRNQEEQQYANAIRRLQSKLKAKGGLQVSKGEEKQIADQISQLEFEIEELGLRRPIEADFESGIDKQFEETMTKNYEIANQMKDGGFASFEEVLEYDNG
tara:strand:- start:457 stop:2082 length:1626 start_codon:yes stop_codon:yes gene_type:complete